MLGVSAKGRHAAIVRELELPVPFDLGQFVAGLERQRARPIRLRPLSLRAGAPVRSVDWHWAARIICPAGCEGSRAVPASSSGLKGCHAGRARLEHR
jgi:hypothetical protein